MPEAVRAAGTLGSVDLAPPPRTLVDILRVTAGEYPDAPAVDDGAAVLTFGQLLDEVTALAARFTARGVGPGARVGVRLPSGANRLYVVILAVLCCGAAYVPVDADDPDERAALVFGEAAVT